MRLILSLALILTLAACGPSHQAQPEEQSGAVAQPEQDEDRSALFFGELAGARYLSEGSFLEFGPNGDFEFLFQAPLRHYPRKSKEGARPRKEVDVLCEVRFVGKAAFYAKKIVPLAPGMRATLANQLELNLADAELVSAAPISRPFPPSEARPAKRICSEYLSLILERKQVDILVRNYSKNSIQLGYLPFEIENRQEDPLAQGVLLYSLRFNSLDENHGDRIFVRQDLPLVE